MYDHVANELVEIRNTHLLVNAKCKSINAHSMGGDGALSMGSSRPDHYGSSPAFAPICTASPREWGHRRIPAAGSHGASCSSRPSQLPRKASHYRKPAITISFIREILSSAKTVPDGNASTTERVN